MIVGLQNQYGKILAHHTSWFNRPSINKLWAGGRETKGNRLQNGTIVGLNPTRPSNIDLGKHRRDTATQGG